MTFTFECENCILTVARQDSYVEPHSFHLARLCCSKHLFPSVANFFDCTVIEFEQLAFKRYMNIVCSSFSFNLLEFCKLSW